ncbi:unnamed protein product [Amoebophrya sp. A25]|nr:unnamed protein product [Amoebophrya sp. A25]|eukprot:GSA25T00000926001.1
MPSSPPVVARVSPRRARARGAGVPPGSTTRQVNPSTQMESVLHYSALHEAHDKPHHARKQSAETFASSSKPYGGAINHTTRGQPGASPLEETNSAPPSGSCGGAESRNESPRRHHNLHYPDPQQNIGAPSVSNRGQLEDCRFFVSGLGKKRVNNANTMSVESRRQGDVIFGEYKVGRGRAYANVEHAVSKSSLEQMRFDSSS